VGSQRDPDAMVAVPLLWKATYTEINSFCFLQGSHTTYRIVLAPQVTILTTWPTQLPIWGVQLSLSIIRHTLHYSTWSHRSRPRSGAAPDVSGAASSQWGTVCTSQPVFSTCGDRFWCISRLVKSQCTCSSGFSRVMLVTVGHCFKCDRPLVALAVVSNHGYPSKKAHLFHANIQRVRPPLLRLAIGSRCRHGGFD